MDRTLRREIREDVMEAIRAAVVQMEERYLTGQELCKQFGMFTPKWLKMYGDVLPRKRVTVTGLDGKSHSTRWAYPQHEIAKGIRDGKYDDLKIMRMG